MDKSEYIYTNHNTGNVNQTDSAYSDEFKGNIFIQKLYKIFHI